MAESDQTTARPRPRRGPSCLAVGLALVAAPFAAATLLGFLGQVWWVLDLMAHFRVQYAAVLTVVTLALALSRRWAITAMVGALALMNLVLIGPYYWSPRPALDDEMEPLKILSLNVNDHRTEYEPVLGLIYDIEPDVVVLIEADQRWVETVEVLGETYPYQVLAPREGFFGMVLMSRYPLDDAQILTIGAAALPSISARIRTGETSLQLVATHPFPPVGPRQAALRNDQLAAVADYVATLPRPVVLVGDLNATPWSLPLRRLLRETGLRDSALGYGVQPSWPSGAALARIQIDNCLVSEDLTVVRRDVGPNVDSDHLPLVVELALPGG